MIYYLLFGMIYYLLLIINKELNIFYYKKDFTFLTLLKIKNDLKNCDEFNWLMSGQRHSQHCNFCLVLFATHNTQTDTTLDQASPKAQTLKTHLQTMMRRCIAAGPVFSSVVVARRCITSKSNVGLVVPLGARIPPPPPPNQPSNADETFQWWAVSSRKYSNVTNERPILMIPGPIEFSDAVLEAVAQPAYAHTAPEFLQIFGESLEMLREVRWTITIKQFSDPKTKGFDSLSMLI